MSGNMVYDQITGEHHFIKKVLPVPVITTDYLPWYLILAKGFCIFFDPACNTIFCGRYCLNNLDLLGEKALGI